MQIPAAPTLCLALLPLVACVNLTKPAEVQKKCASSDTSECSDNTKPRDSGVPLDTPVVVADAPTQPTDTTVTPPIDSRARDTQIADTKATPSDVSKDTVDPPKPDARPEVAILDTRPETSVVEPPPTDSAVPIDTKPPVDTRPPVDTKPPVDTLPPDTKTVGSENCPSVKVISGGDSYSPGVEGGYCVVTCDTLDGWNCSNFDGRTLKVNGQAMKCGDLPLPAKVNGYYVFEVSAGTFSYSALYWWGTPKATCPLPEGGLLP